MAKLKELSIFFPFWNEEENIEKVVENAKGIAEDVAQKWEIIMVDDGSNDNTLQIAEQLAANDKRLRVVTHQPNRGYGAALAAGFANAQYEYIVFTDGDMQFDFSEITKFIDKIHKADIVIGYREKRRDTMLFKRLLLMYLLKVWDRMLFRFSYKDIDCAFKMFHKEAVEQLMPLRSEGAMVSTEILAKATIKKMKIIEVGVTHYPRVEGHQSGANVPVVIRAILESFILWWDLKNGRF
ncbi:MAG TPA: glycosyltransferase family 2 protein [Candidatus Acidoferrales bacterium]|nr:glycosyltransferase family 2 protein [Candidatus Acidoferrales bacterium]